MCVCFNQRKNPNSSSSTKNGSRLQHKFIASIKKIYFLYETDIGKERTINKKTLHLLLVILKSITQMIFFLQATEGKLSGVSGECIAFFSVSSSTHWLANLVIKTPEFDFFWFRLCVCIIYDSRTFFVQSFAFSTCSIHTDYLALPSRPNRQCTMLFISIRSALVFFFVIYNFSLLSFLIGFRQDCWPRAHLDVTSDPRAAAASWLFFYRIFTVLFLFLLLFSQS